MTVLQDVFRPLGLTGRLLLRYWPQLLLLAVLGSLLHDLLLDAAVRVGMENALVGMVILSLVVLAKLAIIVMMFHVLHPALTGLAALEQAKPREAASVGQRRSDHVLAVTAVAILPFFVYYAAWGFLGDTVREYSRLALSRVPFGESAHFLDLLQARWLVASIIVCWLIRWFAKHMNERSNVPYWRFLVVACDATWVFIGLYGLDIYKDQLIEHLGAGASVASAFISSAWADTFRPAEFEPRGFWADLKSLFFYALLPLVWLVMAAIINGYEVASAARPAAAPQTRASTWRKWLKDFIGHFFNGYRSRYAPVWKCLRLTFTAGPATLLTLVIAYQFIGWVGAWAWVGLTRWIGAADLITWQMLADPISLFIGSPSDLDGGVLLDPVRICLLAAVLDHAVASETARAVPVSAAQGKPA